MILRLFSPAPCIFLSILCAGLWVPGQSSYKSIFMVYIERKRQDGNADTDIRRKKIAGADSSMKFEKVTRDGRKSRNHKGLYSRVVPVRTTKCKFVNINR